MRRLDFLSYKLDGTWLKTPLQHTLFPVTLIATLYIGFKFVENGVTIASLAAFALIPIVHGVLSKEPKLILSTSIFGEIGRAKTI